jgi:hypothetical protein
MQKINSEDIKQLAVEFNLSVALIKTVILVESSGTGFDAKTGLIKIQFEPSWFEKFARTKILNGVELQKAEYEAYNKAYAINKEAAMKATSWGMGQVMGFNHKQAGYASVAEMVDAFRMGEYYQLKGMLKFIAAFEPMMRALRKQEWALFASYYNGPKYKQFAYDTKLKETYQKLTK